MAEFEHRVRGIIADPALTYRQRLHRLAGIAEEAVAPPAVGDACREAQEKGVICDLAEGHAPYRPRYVLPDYAVLLRNGSSFLELAPPRDLDEALAFLLIAYTAVPSITTYPVYLGDLDKLLTPFVEEISDEELYRRLRLFWISLDRMLPDAFVHTNLGPDDTRVGRTILRLERELLQVVPNLTLKVDPARTPDDLLLDGVQTVFACGKPHFVNHPMMVGDLGPDYAAVSCYNSLKIGGGSHTLVRLNLAEAVRHCQGGARTFLTQTLPLFVELTAELMEARIRYLVETADVYSHDWLVAEGLISLDRFSAMFGIYGLAEAVEALLEREGKHLRYGQDAEANDLSYRITSTVAELVAARPLPYCVGNGGRAFLHSQSGIDSDTGVTAGTRIPVGREPALFEHLNAVAPHHRLFAAGISDVLHFDDTARRNPQAVVDIIRGAFVSGMRDFTFNLDSNDFIRITGYLVRKSDLARVESGARHESTFLGAGSVAQSHVDRRAPKRVISHERNPRPDR
ncbi:YjjI family glycine radical enzyme [Dactylosporangium sp. AC04546]|uniref:YjjI family glycine radical enzyme n=1 Tax=Dactylosporangium sp. AC04546 TaxID=2862460 RepID=UPI001EDE1589|nr:YjjI family glycine radical enzyme [Dactylosporangium sp. AC04546]WVK84210.1 YjjI family glycine radical enzyme [Dactylosporangium sp. AC04546]